MQHRNHREQSGPDPLVIIMLAAGVLIALPCVLIVLSTRWLPRRLTEWWGFWALVAIVGVCCLTCFVLLVYPFRSLQNQMILLLSDAIRQARTGTWNVFRLWADLRLLWLESLYFAPAVVFLVRLFAPQSAAERLLTQHQKQVAAVRAASERVRRRMARRPLPDQVHGQIVLGLSILGELLEWIVQGLCIIPTVELGKHGVVIGASGSGKSETLLRLAV